MASKDTADSLMRVVVVDDDEDARLYFRDILQSTGDFTFAKDFANATEALAGIPCLRPDLAVMDICMPGLNGIECTKRLKRAMPGLKIVILTGTHDEDLERRSLQAGADAYLTKPVTADQCLATLRFVAARKTETGQDLQETKLESLPVQQQETRLPLSQRKWKQLAGAAGYDSKKLATLCNLSARQLQRDFHDNFGRSPQDYLNEERIKAAQQLLLSGHSVKAVAFELGFKQTSHFCRQFKLQINLTPLQYVAQAHGVTPCRSQTTNVAVG
jgi:DNA-binding NarL/FixJ family response regulator